MPKNPSPTPRQRHNLDRLNAFSDQSSPEPSPGVVVFKGAIYSFFNSLTLYLFLSHSLFLLPPTYLFLFFRWYTAGRREVKQERRGTTTSTHAHRTAAATLVYWTEVSRSRSRVPNVFVRGVRYNIVVVMIFFLRPVGPIVALHRTSGSGRYVFSS